MSVVRQIFVALFAAFVMAASPLAASAGDPMIDAAKVRGQVGEQIDGYLGTIGEVDPALQRKVEEINSLRREVYSNLADQQGQSLSMISRLSGIKLIEKEESGRYVFDDSSRWVKK